MKIAKLLILLVWCIHPSLGALRRLPQTGNICIIGSGAAGIHAAARLKSNGYKVTVLERERKPSALIKKFGKVCTLDLGENSVVDMGPIQVGIGHKYTLDWLKQLSLELYEPHEAYTLRRGENPHSHVIQSSAEEYFPYGEQWEILKEAYRFELIIQDFLSRYPRLQDLPNDSPYTENFAAFAERHGLSHFHRMVSIYTSAYGYGITSEIQTSFVLRMLPSFGLLYWLYWGINLKMITKGFGGLMEAIVEKHNLHDDIRYDQQIKRISRTPGEIKVEFVDGYKEIFDRLLVACPIDKVIETFADGGSEAENTLSNNLKYSPYATIAALVPDLMRGGWVLPENFNLNGRLQMISKNSPSDDIAILYVPLISSISVHDLNQGLFLPNVNDIIEQARKDLAELGFDVDKVLANKIWLSYKPHFAKPSLYGLAESLQGHNNTYYIGTMLSHIDYVDEAFKQANSILEKHFEGNFSKPDKGLLSVIDWHRLAQDIYTPAQHKNTPGWTSMASEKRE